MDMVMGVPISDFPGDFDIGGFYIAGKAHGSVAHALCTDTTPNGARSRGSNSVILE